MIDIFAQLAYGFLHCLTPLNLAMLVVGIVVGLLIGVLHFGLSFTALKMAGDLSSPAIVMQSYVPMTTLLAWWWLGERFAWRTGTAIALSFGGVLVLGFDPLVLDNPASLVLMLVSAFAGRELILKAYAEAVAQRYRFYSYGDAMLIA